MDNGDGTGTLAGTPAVGSGGVYPITITASNGVAPEANQSFTLTVDEPPSITSGAGTTFTTGSAGTFTVTTGGLSRPRTQRDRVPPERCDLRRQRRRHRRPRRAPRRRGPAALYPITITGYNGIGTQATQSFTLTVDQAAAITSGASTTFTAGSDGSFTVTTTGFPTAALSETGNLPERCDLRRQRRRHRPRLAGTPAAGSGGAYPITITATNGVGSRGHAVLHADGGRGALHHVGYQHDVHGRQRRDVHRHDGRVSGGGAVRDRVAPERCDLDRQRRRHRHAGRAPRPPRPVGSTRSPSPRATAWAARPRSPSR